MTVKELIDQLLTLPGNAEVILQSDAEGNGYSPAVGVEECIYRPETTWSGHTYPADEDSWDEYEYEPEDKDQVAVVLWPVN